MGKTCICYPIPILATAVLYFLSNIPSVFGRGLCMGVSVCSHLLTDTSSFSTVIVVNNGAANIQVKVIYQRSDFTRDSAGSFLKNYFVI